MRADGGALRQGLVTLVGCVAMGLATEQSLEDLADVVVAAGPALTRLKGDLVLAKLEASMKPRKPRITSGTYRRAAAGDPEAIRQLRDREREEARGRRRKAVPA